MQACLAPPFRQGPAGRLRPAEPRGQGGARRRASPTRRGWLRLVAPLPPGADAPARQRACAKLALLAGSAVMARVVEEDAGVALEIAAAATAADAVVRVAGEDAAAPCHPPLGSAS